MVSEGLFSKEDRRTVYSASTAEEVFTILDNNETSLLTNSTKASILGFKASIQK